MVGAARLVPVTSQPLSLPGCPKHPLTYPNPNPKSDETTTGWIINLQAGVWCHLLVFWFPGSLSRGPGGFVLVLSAGDRHTCSWLSIHRLLVASVWSVGRSVVNVGQWGLPVIRTFSHFFLTSLPRLPRAPLSEHFRSSRLIKVLFGCLQLLFIC